MSRPLLPVDLAAEADDAAAFDVVAAVALDNVVVAAADAEDAAAEGRVDCASKFVVTWLRKF